eukprot:6672957-Prymnesium_polylepis.1
MHIANTWRGQSERRQASRRARASCRAGPRGRSLFFRGDFALAILRIYVDGRDACRRIVGARAGLSHVSGY